MIKIRLPSVAWSLLLIIILSNCYSTKYPRKVFEYSKHGYHRAAPPEINSSELKDLIEVNDKVFITTLDGSELKFFVKQVQSNQIVGEKQKVNFADIQSIRVKRPSLFKSVGLILGGVLFGWIVYNFYNSF